MNRIKNVSRVLLVMVIMTFIAACALAGPERKAGKLVGYEASFGLDEATKGEIKDMDFGGVLILELEEEGYEVKAVVDKQLVKTLKGGDMLTIEAIEGSEIRWKVIGLAEK
jgi:hypothetical protein